VAGADSRKRGNGTCLNGVGASNSIKHRRTTAPEPRLKNGRWEKAVPISSISTELAALCLSVNMI
jgi:hypothetical protein